MSYELNKDGMYETKHGVSKYTVVPVGFNVLIEAEITKSSLIVNSDQMVVKTYTVVGKGKQVDTVEIDDMVHISTSQRQEVRVKNPTENCKYFIIDVSEIKAIAIEYIEPPKDNKLIVPNTKKIIH